MATRTQESFSARRTRIALAALAALLPAAAGQAAEPVSFKETIFPLIQFKCGSCHKPGGEGYEKSGLDLRTYEGLMKGTKFGPVIVPGDAFTSNLMVLIEGRADPKLRMPLGLQKLNACDKDDLRRWINQGAKNN